MTQPNLDALAKLGPFTSRSTWGGDEFIGSDGETIDTEVAEAALNEWVELRAEHRATLSTLMSAQNEILELTKEVVELRAYKARSVPGLQSIIQQHAKLEQENAELRATVELVAGNLLAAQEKRDDAPMSADAHIDEAVTALKVYTGNVSYSDEAKALRAKLWSTTGAMAAELAELRAYRERTEEERSEMLRLLAYCRPRVQSYEECNETYCANGSDHEVHKRIGELLDAAEGDPAPKEASDGN